MLLWHGLLFSGTVHESAQQHLTNNAAAGEYIPTLQLITGICSVGILGLGELVILEKDTSY